MRRGAANVTLGEPVEAKVSRCVGAEVSVDTEGQGFTDLTPALREFVARVNAADGVLTAFVTHTTASLTVQENADTDVQRDLLDALDALAPANRTYRHGAEGADDMPGHIKSVLSGVSIVVPVSSGRLALGTWQALYLIEHRSRGRSRQVRLNYLGS